MSNQMRKSKRNNKKKLSISFFSNYINRDINKLQFNNSIFLLVVLIGIVGIFTLLSASSYLTIKYDLSKYSFAIRQTIFFIIGIIVMLLISKIDIAFYKDNVIKLYIFMIILLFLVYIPPFSSPQNGARRWINIGIDFMPSDLAKPISLMMLIFTFIKLDRYRDKFSLNVLVPGVIILIPFVLILFQTDLSTAAVLGLSLGIVYLVGGINYKFIWHILGIGVAFISLLALNFRGYQLDRITAFLNPEAHYNDLSWQVLNGLFAVSRGGVDGVGFGKSIYKYGYLSNEVNNDMIFSVFAEERGFIGSVFLLILIFMITYLIIKESLKSKDKFSKLLCFGIGILYFVQSMINIGVALSVIPNTGITLPFISNGGTSLVAYYAMMGIVLNISRRNNYDKKIEIKNSKLNL